MGGEKTRVQRRSIGAGPRAVNVIVFCVDQRSEATGSASSSASALRGLRYAACMAQPGASHESRDEELVRRIVTEALRGRPVRIFLFGSRARGDASVASDFDVAILPEEPLSRDVLSRIRESLEESCLPVTVDLVDLTDAPAALRAQVLEEGREWIVSRRA